MDGETRTTRSNGRGHPHIDARSLAMARIIAKKIDADPALLEHAHRYLAHEEALHATLCPASREWREMLKRPWPEIRARVLEESDEGQRLRSSAPFAEIISEEERIAVIERYPPPWPVLPYDAARVPPEVMDRVLADSP